MSADPKVEHFAIWHPVKIAWTFATVRINMDDTLTYSPAKWAAFQHLNPPLKLAMDEIQSSELTEPLGLLAHAFIKEGEIDKEGVLRYKLYNPGSATPVKAAVVPFALKIALLMYFHQVHGCINQQETICIARKYIYFKNEKKVHSLP